MIDYKIQDTTVYEYNKHNRTYKAEGGRPIMFDNLTERAQNAVIHELLIDIKKRLSMISGEK
jgi:hypothetical protein